MPNARTATTATPSSSTGGCWAARAMSQAAVAMRPIPHADAAAPARVARMSRGSTGRASASRRATVLTGRSPMAARQALAPPPRRVQDDDPVGQGQDGRPVGHDERRASHRGLADRLDHAGFGLRIQVGRGFVE